MKKCLTAILLASVLSISLIGPATAAERISAPSALAVTASSKDSLRAEITEWKYRDVNGQRQMRLWSNTENKWLTDWINV